MQPTVEMKIIADCGSFIILTSIPDFFVLCDSSIASLTIRFQVVSADHGSVVNVWYVDTGEKVIMFTGAHDGHEITAMCFDPTRRRLITGSRVGTVKIWNFNNGACLRELDATHDGEVRNC